MLNQVKKQRDILDNFLQKIVYQTLTGSGKEYDKDSDKGSDKATELNRIPVKFLKVFGKITIDFLTNLINLYLLRTTY